jgi:hypothetical protein
MKNVFPTVMIGIVYVFVVGFGQKWMKNQKPFQLYYFMIVYNLFQVIICAYLAFAV